MKESASTDNELVRAARDGSLGAYSLLVERHQGRLFHFLLQITGNREEAEDLTQEAFVRAYRKIERFREDRGEFISWLFTMARRIAIRAWRKSKPAEPLDEAAARGLAAPDDPPDGRADRSWIWQQARKTLSADSFMAVWLHYQEDLGLDEVADALKRSRGATKVLLHRSRQRLGKAIDGEQARELMVADRTTNSLSIV